MRARIGTLSRRLAKAETVALDDSGALRGGVMVVPPILPAGEWEAIAVPTLAALALAAREDIDRHAPPTPFREAMPEPLYKLVEGVDYHTPNPHRNQSPVPMPPKPPRPPSTGMIR